MVVAEGVWEEPLAAGVAMGEGVMIEEVTIVVILLEADTVGGIEVGLGATLRTESSKRRLDGYDYRRMVGFGWMYGVTSPGAEIYTYLQEGGQWLKSSGDGAHQVAWSVAVGRPNRKK